MMFARDSTYELPPGKAAVAEQEFRSAIERIAELDGLHEAFLFVSEDGDLVRTLTVWETHEAMTASRVAATVARRAAAEALGGGVSSAVEYRVAIHVTAADVRR
jgi:heme-degrading monooxygenase HmoA